MLLGLYFLMKLYCKDWTCAIQDCFSSSSCNDKPSPVACHTTLNFQPDASPRKSAICMFATSHAKQGASCMEQGLPLQELALAVHRVDLASHTGNCILAIRLCSNMLRYLQVIKFCLQHLHRFADSLPATVIQVWADFVGCASSLLQDVYRWYVLTWQLE